MAARLAEQLQVCLRDRASLGYSGFLVGMSGGVDSAVCARLIVDAVGEAATAAVVDLGDELEAVDAAWRQAETIGLRCRIIDARAIYTAQRGLVREQTMMSRIHLRSRLITSILFQLADNEHSLVIDTTDRSELELRLYEEGRRGNVAPLADLYKSEVFVVAEQMGLGDLRSRPSGCPDLDNEDAFGLPWDQLDWFIDALATGRNPTDIQHETGIDGAWLSALVHRIRSQSLRTDLVRLRVGSRSQAD